MDNLQPFNYKNLIKQTSAKTLNRSICVPSVANAYAQAIEYAKHWFLGKFKDDLFKSIYVDGKHIYGEQRSLSKTDTIVRTKPALAIIPAIDWSFNNENVDMYQHGLDVYQQQGLFKDSFFKDREHQVYLGIAMETISLAFSYRIRVLTRSQQLDLFKYAQLACRVGNSTGEDVDLDFHVPYELMIQIALDLGYEVDYTDNESYPKIKNLRKFLSYLNTKSQLPFLYKYRALNGRNEFFIRMQRMYIHVRPTDITADDGDRQGHLNTNFGIELQAEVRFPAPKLYGYYSNNEPDTKMVYNALDQPDGAVSTFYTFKGTPIKDTNNRGWNLSMETTWEEDNDAKLGDNLVIDFNDLLMDGDIGNTIVYCEDQNISPAIFCDIVIVNGGDVMSGTMDWNTRTFTSSNPSRTLSSYIGIYIDMSYVNNYIAVERDANKNRMQHTQDPQSIYEPKNKKE